MVFRHSDMFCFPSVSLFAKGILRHLPLPANVHFMTLFLAINLTLMGTSQSESDHILLGSSKKKKRFFPLLLSISPLNSISLFFSSHTSTF